MPFARHVPKRPLESKNDPLSPYFFEEIVKSKGPKSDRNFRDMSQWFLSPLSDIFFCNIFTRENFVVNWDLTLVSLSLGF